MSLGSADRIAALIALTRDLGAVIAEENAHLREGRPQAIAPLQGEKARLAAAYAKAIRDVAASPDAVGSAGEDLLEELRAITRDFEAGAASQRALLAGSLAASEGVVKAIAAEAGAHGAGYGQGADRRPVAVNQKA